MGGIDLFEPTRSFRSAMTSQIDTALGQLARGVANREPRLTAAALAAVPAIRRTLTATALRAALAVHYTAGTCAVSQPSSWRRLDPAASAPQRSPACERRRGHAARCARRRCAREASNPRDARRGPARGARLDGPAHPAAPARQQALRAGELAPFARSDTR